MKSRIEIRKFAVESAIAIMGNGTPDKDIVSKAKEIETYVVGEAVLPETYDDMSAVSGLASSLLGAIDVKETTKKK